MDNTERRRKLKQAYELLSIANEIAQDVLNTTEGWDDDALDDLQALVNELNERAADLSGFCLEDGVFGGV